MTSTPLATVPQVVLIADDLTGACDAGVAFAARGLRTRVGFGSSPQGAADVIAISTNSRRFTAKEAGEHVAAVMGQASIPPETIIFKKIDSVGRGHIVAEVEAVLSATGIAVAILAPALPSQGRIIAGGKLQLNDISGATELDLVALLQEQGAVIGRVEVHREEDPLQAALGAEIAAGHRFILCDASSEADLRRIASAMQSLHQRILWVGSAGLSEELATLVRSAVVPVAQGHFPRKVLICVGSTHAVTKMQVQRLCSAFVVRHITESELAGISLDDVFSSAGIVIVTLDMETLEHHGPRALLRSAAENGVQRMVMTGGDTAEMLCKLAGAESLLLTGQVLPGIPAATIVGGLLNGMELATKSGGFGAEDCLCTLATTAFPVGSKQTQKEYA